MTGASVLRAARRVAARLGNARRPMMQVAYAELDRGADDWHRWARLPAAPSGLLDRAAFRVALGATLYVLAGGQYAWAESCLWLCGRRSTAASDAAWAAQKAPERCR